MLKFYGIDLKHVRFFVAFLNIEKIYAKRFSTDCFSDYFVEKALRSTIGIDDILEYMTEKATLEEMKEQNSYFIGSLLNHENKNTENNNIENINIENKNIENKNVKNKNTEK